MPFKSTSLGSDLNRMTDGLAIASKSWNKTLSITVVSDH